MALLRLALLPLLSLSAAIPAVAQPAPPTVDVVVEGAVGAPGRYTLPLGSRLSEAVAAAQPHIDAYTLGAALLRKQDQEEQVRLKAGLLHDLKQLSNSADADIAGNAAVLHAWIESLPVTGRVLRQTLEPRLLEIQPKLDPVVKPGDRVVYPARATEIRVIGAVARPCELPQLAEQAVQTYLRACPATAAADRDYVYAIQPDGNVQQIGIAAWNRGSPQALAPGGVLYIPLSERATRTIDPEFNRQLAEFVATQLLLAPGATP